MTAITAERLKRQRNPFGDRHTTYVAALKLLVRGAHKTGHCSGRSRDDVRELRDKRLSVCHLGGALVAGLLGCGGGTPAARPSDAGQLAAGGTSGGADGDGRRNGGDQRPGEGRQRQRAPLFRPFRPDDRRRYSFEISADNWAKLDADFHDIKDVLAGTPPQTYYPIVFHYGSETVSNAAVRLRGKSSWVNTVMFDENPKMAFDISFDQYDTHQKFHGVGTLHFEMARDEWSFLSERVGNNWFREIGLTAPCSNSATITVNGQFYGLYVAEEGITKSLLAQFFPGNADGDLFKGGTEPHTNIAAPNWTKLQALNSAMDIGDPADARRCAEHRARVGRGGRRGRR